MQPSCASKTVANRHPSHANPHIQKAIIMRIIIKLKSTESSHHYVTTKNKKNNPERLELRKYDPILRRHALYKESK